MSTALASIPRETLERAFQAVHKPDSPVHSLDELLSAALLLRLVEGTALRLERGQGLGEPADVSGPITARPAPMPAAKTAGRFPGAYPVPARRRGDAGPDLKSRAAGERDDE